MAVTDTVWLTADEAAARMRVSHWTIRRWVKDGKLPAQRLPNRELRIHINDIDNVGVPTSTKGTKK